MTYILVTLSYDGGNYHGWIKQKNAIGIQNILDKKISIVIKNKNFNTIAVSKTDTNVHAEDQKVLLSFDFNIENLDKFINAINKSLPSDIKIKDAIFVDENFNIRNVKQKTYIYTINNDSWNVFSSRYELIYLKNKLNCETLQKYANIFVGYHDFSLFSGLNHKEMKHINVKRIIDDIKIYKDENNKIKLQFVAKGFIRYQIRIIVGHLLALMENKISINEIKNMLKGIGKKQRYIVSGNGLCLKKVIFE